MLRISIVTVCYNMEKYIEQTILSIINQNYPNLEYIVIDGGSTDETCTIIKKYIEHISYFVSEPDKGMYDAINKGMAHATGDVVAWLNADDLYFPWTLEYVNMVFSSFPGIAWISGLPAFIDENGLPSRMYTYPGAKARNDIRRGRFNSSDLGFLQQEGMFWRKSLFNQVNGLDVSLKYAGDYDLWIKFSEREELYSLCVPLAMFRQRRDSLSASGREYEAEMAAVKRRFGLKSDIISPLDNKLCISRVLKVLRRLVIRKKSPILIYSPGKGNFEIVRWLRPVASYSLRDARLFSKQK